MELPKHVLGRDNYTTMQNVEQYLTFLLLHTKDLKLCSTSDPPSKSKTKGFSGCTAEDAPIDPTTHNNLALWQCTPRRSQGEKLLSEFPQVNVSKQGVSSAMQIVTAREPNQSLPE